METSNRVLARLAAPFPANKIHFRPGATTKDKSSAIALAYLTARDVEGRLDEVCGPLNWQCRYPWSEGGRLVCEIGIRRGALMDDHEWKGIENGALIDTDEWIWKADGAGDTSIEAEKGAFSGALKRAAVRWMIGRYLYDLPNKFWPLENGRFSAETQKELTERLAAWQERYFERRAA